MKKLIFIFGFFVSTLSYSADWVLFSTSGKNKENYTEHFYDESSVNENKNKVVSLWVRAYEVENKFRAEMNTVINCVDKSTQIKEVFYYSDNKFINNIRFSDKVEIPPPDSVGDSLIKEICKKQAP